MGLYIITEPDIEPLNATEAKAQLRVVENAEDAIVERLIRAARELTENELERACIHHERQYTLDGFPCGAIEIPRPPLISVESITYVDTDGTTQTLSASAYTVHNAYDSTDDPPEIAPETCPNGFVIPAYGTAWPTARDQPESVTITFACGYGNDPDQVPAAIRSHMLVRIADLFTEQRQDVMVGASVASNGALKALAAPFKLWKLS